MPRAIVQIKDKYFVWSTIVDAPISYALSEKDLKVRMLKETFSEENINNIFSCVQEYGWCWQFKASLEKLNKTMEKEVSLERFLVPNRAGTNERSILMNTIYKRYNLNV